MLDEVDLTRWGMVEVAHTAQLAVSLARLTRPVNYLGLPALGVPCGFSNDGMPVGFQLIGRPFAEATLFNAGHLYQMATAWHMSRPGGILDG